MVVFLAWVSRFKQYKYGLEFAFIILTAFLAIRYNWGNDYPSYLRGFIEINSYNYKLFDFGVLQSFRDGEVGWVFLNRLFAPLGFFGLVIFLTTIEHYILYKFIKKYVEPTWYWFALFIFVFSSGFMLTGSSMMRQFLAMCIYIYATDFIIKRKPIQFVLLVLLAASFHTSAYILLPTYLVTYINFKIKPQYLLIIIPAFYLWSAYAVDIVGDSVTSLMRLEDFDKYEGYIGIKNKNEGGNGLGVLFLNVLFFTCIYNLYKLQPHLKMLGIIALIGFLLTPLTPIAGLINRLGIYFSILSIVIYPILFSKIENNIYKHLVIIGYIVLSIKGFIDFFYSEVWHDRFFEYQTIFNATNWM